MTAPKSNGGQAAAGGERVGEDAPAELVAGKYEIVRLLGQGGMGSVYEARHALTGKRVALKRMSPAFATDPVAVQRFLREARVATSIEHPNVVEIFDVGAADGSPYMVMAFLEGMALADHIASHAPMAPKAMFTLLAPILEALDAAHRIGIVHRDIKPDNIFLARVHGGEVVPKLLDFGISKSAEGEDFKLTRTGAVMGTPYYMSPEQARGERSLDGRTDLYAMGVILYECLTGKLPFTADNYNALLLKIVMEEAPSLADARPELPRALVEAVDRAMAKSRDQRFASTLELRNALARALGEPERETVVPLQFAATAELPALSDPLAQSGIEPARARDSEATTALADTRLVGVPAERAITGPGTSEGLPAKARAGLVALAAALVVGGLGLAATRGGRVEEAVVPVTPSAATSPVAAPAQASAPQLASSAPVADDVGGLPAQGTGASRLMRARLCAAQGLDRCVTDLLLGQAQSEEELALLIDTLVRLGETTVAREQARRYRQLYPRGSRFAELARLADDGAPRGAEARTGTATRAGGAAQATSPGGAGATEAPSAAAPTMVTETPARTAPERRAGGLDESEF